MRLGNGIIGDDVLKKVFGFALLYLLIFCAGAIIMSLFNLDIVSAFAASAACLNNIGPGLGVVGPTDNYHSIPDLGKWMLSILMLIGRLEVYTVVILISRSFWKN